jgi:hypothetical protein
MRVVLLSLHHQLHLLLFDESRQQFLGKDELRWAFPFESLFPPPWYCLMTCGCLSMMMAGPRSGFVPWTPGASGSLLRTEPDGSRYTQLKLTVRALNILSRRPRDVGCLWVMQNTTGAGVLVSADRVSARFQANGSFACGVPALSPGVYNFWFTINNEDFFGQANGQPLQYVVEDCPPGYAAARCVTVCVDGCVTVWVWM